jgi:two-component system KDP operon response regulator KdpE
MIKVLVVDDEEQIRRALTVNLSARGYDVVQAATGQGALLAAADHHPDVVLLDLGLPDLDGLEVLRGLRGWSQVPVVVLTVRDDERSKVNALDLGADDYVTKPFGINELMARLRAALRRAPGSQADEPVVRTAHFALDLVAKRASIDGVDARLTPIEWALVEELVRHPHRLLTQRQLITAVWGPNYEPDSNLLRVHFTHIRRKLEPDRTRPRYFITEPGMGYRFEPGEDGV